MIRSVIISFAFLLVTAATASADEVPCPEQLGCTVWVPDGWTKDAIAQGSEALLVAHPAADDAGLLYAVFDGKNFDAAMKSLDAVLAAVFTDAKVEKGGAVKVGGKPALAFGGKAKDKASGKPVSIVAVFVQADRKHVLLAMGMAQDAVIERYRPDLNKALGAIRLK